MNKIYVNATVRLVIDADVECNIDSVLSEMDYNFKSNTKKAEIIETEITGWDITYLLL